MAFPIADREEKSIRHKGSDHDPTALVTTKSLLLSGNGVTHSKNDFYHVLQNIILDA